MALGKPDITKFDSDDDSIKDARPEMQTAFTSLNTIIDNYNAETLPGTGSNVDLPTEAIPYTAFGNNYFAVSSSTSVDYKKVNVARKVGTSTIDFNWNLNTQSPGGYGDSIDDIELPRGKKAFLVCIDDGTAGTTYWRVKVFAPNENETSLQVAAFSTTAGQTKVFEVYHLPTGLIDSAGGTEGILIANEIENGLLLQYD